MATKVPGGAEYDDTDAILDDDSLSPEDAAEIGDEFGEQLEVALAVLNGGFAALYGGDNDTLNTIQNVTDIVNSLLDALEPTRLGRGQGGRRSGRSSRMDNLSRHTNKIDNELRSVRTAQNALKEASRGGATRSWASEFVRDFGHLSPPDIDLDSRFRRKQGESEAEHRKRIRDPKTGQMRTPAQMARAARLARAARVWSIARRIPGVPG